MKDLPLSIDECIPSSIASCITSEKEEKENENKNKIEDELAGVIDRSITRGNTDATPLNATQVSARPVKIPINYATHVVYPLGSSSQHESLAPYASEDVIYGM